jgi:V/A-type H+-transporting ATPase subunit E
MEAQSVIDKILADAGAEAEKITKEAQQKEAAQQDNLAAQLQQYNKQTDSLAQKAAKDEESHILAAARMEIAKEFLAEKRKILDEIFELSRRQLQSLPDDQYRNLITKLLLEAVETGDEEVIVDKNEYRIDQQFIDQINQRLSSGEKANLRLSQDRADIEGGFILRRGKIKTNVSFDVLLAHARKELEIELAKELFS